MNASELKYQHESNNPDSYFFDRNSMKFFGDTMHNYGVRAVTVTMQYDASGRYVEQPVTCEAWELYRRRPVKHGMQSSAYFDKNTFARIHPARS